MNADFNCWEMGKGLKKLKKELKKLQSKLIAKLLLLDLF